MSSVANRQPSSSASARYSASQVFAQPNSPASRQAVRASPSGRPLCNPDRGLEKALQRTLAERSRDLATERDLVQHGWHLAPKQRRSDELLLAERGACIPTDPVEGERDDQARIAGEQ